MDIDFDNLDIFHRCECGFAMKLGVFMSAAGYYIGYTCNNCGPYSRISGYYKTRKDAELNLNHYKRVEMRCMDCQNHCDY